jgi:transcriptional regulator with XRE-family HTH domain
MTRKVSYAQWLLEPYTIGLKLRSLRTQRRMTLAKLAAETGLSTALLSKLETERMIPTLPTLATISRVYGVGMSHVFKEPTRHSLSITRKAHLEGNDRGMEPVRVLPLNALGQGLPLAASVHASQGTGGGSGLAAQMIEFAGSGPVCASECLHQTTGLVYVLEGRLQQDSGGLQELLEAGDCVYVESDMAIMWSAAGKQRCRVLAVFPGAERTER